MESEDNKTWMDPEHPLEIDLVELLDSYVGNVKSVTVTYGKKGDDKWVSTKVELYQGAYPLYGA